DADHRHRPGGGQRHLPGDRRPPAVDADDTRGHRAEGEIAPASGRGYPGRLVCTKKTAGGNPAARNTAPYPGAGAPGILSRATPPLITTHRGGTLPWPRSSFASA